MNPVSTVGLDLAKHIFQLHEADSAGVWSRNEVVRVDLEGCWVLGPGIADGLEWCSPSQRFEVVGEVVGRDKGQNVSFEALQGLIVEDLDGPVLDGPVHPLSLAVGPGMIGLGQLVRDPVLVADPVKDMDHPVPAG